MAGSRGTANLVQSCHFCKAEFSASVEAATSFETLDVEKHEHEKATLIVIEARGCEPVESSLEGLTFTGTTPTGETVEIELEEEGEWYGATESGDELAVAESLCKWELAAAPAGRKGKK